MNKKLFVAFLFLVAVFLVRMCAFPETVHVVKIESENIGENRALKNMLSEKGLLADAGKNYYEITCRVSFKSNVPVPVTPALKVNARNFKVKAFLLPFSVCKPSGNVIFPFEKAETVRISPFGKFNGVFIFVAETPKNVEQKDLTKNISFSAANCIKTGSPARCFRFGDIISP